MALQHPLSLPADTSLNRSLKLDFKWIRRPVLKFLEASNEKPLLPVQTIFIKIQTVSECMLSQNIKRCEILFTVIFRKSGSGKGNCALGTSEPWFFMTFGRILHKNSVAIERNWRLVAKHYLMQRFIMDFTQEWQQLRFAGEKHPEKDFIGRRGSWLKCSSRLLVFFFWLPTADVTRKKSIGKNSLAVVGISWGTTKKCYSFRKYRDAVRKIITFDR